MRFIGNCMNLPTINTSFISWNTYVASDSSLRHRSFRHYPRHEQADSSAVKDKAPFACEPSHDTSVLPQSSERSSALRPLIEAMSASRFRPASQP